MNRSSCFGFACSVKFPFHVLFGRHFFIDATLLTISICFTLSTLNSSICEYFFILYLILFQLLSPFILFLTKYNTLYYDSFWIFGTVSVLGEIRTGLNKY
jgi:hypothetical protein